MLTMSESSVQRASTKTRRFPCCILVYYICERFARIPANLPAGLEDLISSRTDRNTCNPPNEESFLDYASYAAFLSYTERGREKELSRLYIVTNLSWLCKKPALITRRNQETSSDCAGERVCVFLRCSSHVISLDMGSTLSRRYFPKVKISPRASL